MQLGARSEGADPGSVGRPRHQPDALGFLTGGGACGAALRTRDWSGSPLGSPETWPQSLRSVAGLLLGSNFPMFVAWGPELSLLYNDAYAEILGDKHPAALGARFHDVWKEIWPEINPLIEAALSGEASYREDLRLVMNRRGHDEETWFTFSYSPVRDESGAVAGMFCACTETTARVKLETDLKESEARFRAAADSSPALMWMSDAGGEIVFANKRYKAFFDVETEAMLGTGWRRIVHPDDVEAFHQAYLESLAERRAVHLEVRVLHPTLGVRWLSCDGAPRFGPDGGFLGYAGVNVDITDSRTAEAALRESEARLRALTDHLPGGMVYQIAAEPGGSRRFIHVSQSYEELAGIPAEAVLADARVAYDAIHPDDRPALAAAEAEVMRTGGTFDVQVRFRRADGELRWCRIISAPREQPDGSTIWDGIQIDITDHKRAEHALRQREARLRLALEAGRMAEVTFHIPEATVSHGPAFAALFGRPLDYNLSLDEIRAAYHPDDCSRVLAKREAILAGRQDHYEIEKRIVRPDGEVRWVYGRGRVERDAEGRAVTVTAVYLDETDRKAAEAELRKTESRLRLIADALPVLIAHIGADLRYRFVNQAYETWFGIPCQEVIGHSVQEIIGPAAWEKSEPTIRRVLSGERVSLEEPLPYSLGGTRHVHVDFVPATAPDGTPDGYYALIHDVSEARRNAAALQDLAGTLEQRVRERTAELEQAYEQLRQSQKLEAMGQLTGGVAHDFNNLLTPIVGGLDLLQRRGVGGEREQRLIAGALQSAERAKTLVQRLLAFARRQPLQASAVDIGALVTGMADLVASTSGPQIKVVVDIDPDLPPAKADPNQLEMAILNLSVNARDAMRDGGSLTIAASAESIERDGRSKLAPGQYVRLRVSDTGVGMDEATLGRAIEPFFSTKGIGKGTGLGLSMVHGLASQLGGALLLKSKPGLGTCAELWLPVSAAAASRAAGGTVAASPEAPSGKVLLVDDEAVVRESTAAMLSELGFEVVEADSAEAALAILAADDHGVEMLVTDHLMPGMSGTDLARRVRQDRPGLPVMIVSGYAEAEAIAPDLPRLVKPFRQDDLAAKIAAVQGSA